MYTWAVTETPREPTHISEAKRAGTRVSLISLAVIWALLAVLLLWPALLTHSRGKPFSVLFWVGLVALLFLGSMIVWIWIRIRIRARR